MDHSTDEDKDDAPPVLSEAEANEKIADAVKDFFAVRDIDESENYFIEVTPEYRYRLVEEMVSKAIVSEETDGKLVAAAFARAVEKKLCSVSDSEEGFLPVADVLGCVVVDAPKAIQIMATMMKGAGLDEDEERWTRIAQKLMIGGIPPDWRS